MTAEILCAAGLVLVHLFASRLSLLEGTGRSPWLSAAGGVSIAYVFVDAFPGLAEAQAALGTAFEGMPYAERHAYLIALIGLLTFYGLEMIVARSQRTRAVAEAHPETTTAMGVFWLHMASFAVYNALIGYLLVRGEGHSLSALLFYFIAMAVHFALNDHGFRQDHRDTYMRVGRWLLGAAIVAGWLVGVATEISAAATGVLIAFLAGGVVMNVMKEELPGHGARGFVPFAMGAAVYSLLLLTSS